MNDTDTIFQTAYKQLELKFPVLICLYTGINIPEYCCPMERSPAPAIGMDFGSNFFSVFENAVIENMAVHDGAVMIGRDNTLKSYKITGWSYRLFPKQTHYENVPNKGSAFNSCLAMSLVKTVEKLIVFSNDGIFIFEDGKISNQ